MWLICSDGESEYNHSMRYYIDDILTLAGCGLIVYGTIRIAPELAWFVAGAIFIFWGFAFGRGLSNASSKREKEDRNK